MKILWTSIPLGKAYYSGLISAAKSKKMTTFIYAVTFLLALALAIPFHTIISAQAGNSMALGGLLKHFDYTIYKDFMRSSGKYLDPLISAAIWMGVLYLLFTVFFAGGVLSILSGEDKEFSVQKFLSNCGKFFFRYLRLALALVVIQIITVIIVFFPLSMILSFAYQTVQSEASLFYIFIAGAVAFAILFILVLIIGDYAKIILFKNDSRKVLKSLWGAVKFVFKYFIGTYALYVIILAAPVLFIAIYLFADHAIGMVSGLTIFIMFIIQQAFIWLRLWTKIWFLGSEISFYNLIKEFTNLHELEAKSHEEDTKSKEENILL